MTVKGLTTNIDILMDIMNDSFLCVLEVGYSW